MLVPMAGLLTARTVLSEQLSLQKGGCLLVISGLLVSAYGVRKLLHLLRADTYTACWSYTPLEMNKTSSENANLMLQAN